MIRSGKRYRHYKGETYVVITLSKNEATGEDNVVYKSESTGLVWDTPLTRFIGNVDLPNGTGKRFALIEEVNLHRGKLTNLVYSNHFGGLTFRVNMGTSYDDKIIYCQRREVPIGDADNLYPSYKAFILANMDKWQSFEPNEE